MGNLSVKILRLFEVKIARKNRTKSPSNYRPQSNHPISLSLSTISAPALTTYPSHPSQPHESYSSHKSYLLLRRTVAVILTLGILVSELAVPLTYAQQIPPSAEEKPTTLITDNTAAETTPFTGKGHGVNSIVPAMADLQSSFDSAGFEAPAKVRKLAKENFRPNEEIDVVIENGAHREYKTELIDAIGNKVALETQEVETGDAKVIKIEQPSSFRPGKYTLRISDNRGGVSEQDFSWGVLAINPDKSIYTPNETANLAIGVLDEGGDMVCDAQVELQITDPKGSMTSLSTDNGKIIVNPECKSHDFTLKPDYETNYKVSGVGVYKMLLKSQTKNGTFTINDSFEVRANVPFDVKRISATRIYPPNTYPVTLEITANQDFEGTVTETVPGNFKIARPGEEIQSDKDKADELIDAASASSSGETDKTYESDRSYTTDGSRRLDTQPIGPIGLTPSLASALLPYSTINTVGDFDGGKAVLGASVPGLGMPFSGPYPVSQEFGESLVYDKFGHELYDSFGMHGHDGIDFAMPVGTPLLAVDSGKIILAGNGDYGVTIVIQHSWGRSYYGHLSSVEVKAGDEIQRGAQIGRSGNTGMSTGPHLHFGIKPDNNESENGYYGKVDPAYYIGMKQTAQAVLGAATKFDETINAAPTTDVQILTWKINVKKGEKIQLGYNYLAPRISPQFYTLGPATFTASNGEEVFHEIRKWQIASDALEYKFKRGTFTKTPSTTCAATCTQRVAGVGFKPKAVIFEWTLNTSEGFNAHQVMGMGFATSDSQERATSYWSEDAAGTSDTGSLKSATKTIVIQQGSDGQTLAEADFVSFDPDGFTLNWSTNDANAYIIHYTAIGGADVSNAKAGTFIMPTTGSTLSVTDPGFQPDFVMFMGSGGGLAEGSNVVTASMSAGFAAGPNKEGAVAMVSRDNQGTQDSYRVQRTDASIVVLEDSSNGVFNAVADVASFDSTGFTLNITDNPGSKFHVYYLALQGGQYDVGAIAQPTAPGPQSIYTGFRPSGMMTLSASQSASGAIAQTATMTTGGASRDGNNVQWCNDKSGTQCTTDWQFRKKITFNNNPLSEDLENFPVLVKLSSASGNIDFNKTQFNGQDIRFVDPSDPNTVLSHEIESWSEPNGEAYIWVKVPKLDKLSTTDHIWMYYGNASASDGQDATGVWDSDYVAVWHAKENPGGSAPQIQDSTVFNHDGTAAGVMTSADQVSGQINGSLDFDDGDNDNVDYGDITQISGASRATLSTWVKRRSTSTDNVIVMKQDVTSGHGFGVELWNDVGGTIYYDVSNGANQYGVVNNGSTNWQLITLVFDGTQTGNANRLKGYINGDVQNLTYTGTIQGNLTRDTTSFKMGKDLLGSFSNGLTDETRISTATRSAEWIEAEYRTGANVMNDFKAEETQASGGQVFSQGVVWSDDLDAEGTASNANTHSDTNNVIRFASSPTGGGSPRTVAYAGMQSFDSTGFTLNWRDADSTTRLILYWAAGSVTATQEDYRWYKNTNAATPTTALEDENSQTILAKNKPYARLRANLAAGGNGLNASTHGFKLQYAANQPESAVGGTTDWCNDTTGTSCFAPIEPGGEIQGSTVTDWCNDTSQVSCTASWSARRKITFKNASSSAALSSFPVLVKLNSTRIDYNKVQSDGDDIRFVDPSDPNTVLNHEIEGSFTSGGTNYIWVKVPTIDARSNNDYIWMYYGNSTAESPATQAGGTSHATGVWDGDFIMVQHMEEDPSTSNCTGSTEVCDSTTNANNGNMQGAMTNGDQVAGQVGNAMDMDGSDDFFIVEATGNNSLDILTDITISAWIKLTVATRVEGILGKADGVNYDYDLFICDNSGNCASKGKQDMVGFYSDNLTGGNEFFGNTAITDTNWHNVVMTRTGSAWKIYIDGKLDATGTDGASFPSTDLDLYIGAEGSANPILGRLDEVKLSDTGRSTDWVIAEYLSQTDAFNTYGTEFTQESVKQSSSGWQYRKKITFNNASSSAALSSFPVLVKLDSDSIDYNKTQDDGGDIRFVDPNDRTTVLSHDIEKWDENGTSYVWVEVPSLAAGTADYIWMYYGNPGVSDGQDANGTWDNNFRGVWHLADTSTTADDETSNGNDLSLSGSASWMTGKIDGAWNGLGSNWMTRADDADLDFGTSSFSISAWFKSDSVTNPAASEFIVDKEPGSVAVGGYGIFLNTSGQVVFGVDDDVTGFPEKSAVGTTDVYDGNWHHVFAVKNGTTSISIYVDGVFNTTTSLTGTTGTIDNDDTFIVGSQDTSDDSDDFNGDIDELKISTNISTDWIVADFLSGAGQMSILGEEQGYTTAGTAAAGWIDVADQWCNAGSSCNTSWTYRKRITINNQSSTTNLTNVPVLVKLDSSRIDYSKTRDSGQDIRFVDPENPTAILAHDIEKWNENGASYVWVEVPQLDLKSGVDSVWMYYGNASASDGQSGSGTWDNSYSGVWHFNEITGPTAVDKTSNINNLTLTTDTWATNSGKIDGGWNGTSSNWISRADDDDFDYGTNSFTVSLWFKSDSTANPTATEYLLNKSFSGGTQEAGYTVYATATTGTICFGVDDDSTWGSNLPEDPACSTADLYDGNWHHLTGVKNGTSSVTVYIDGVAAGSDTTIGTNSLSNAKILYVGDRNGTDDGDEFKGDIDQVELIGSSTARSADWIFAQYLIGSDQIATYNPEETQTTSAWRYKDNSTVTDRGTISTSVLGTSASGNQLSFQESNITALIPTAIAVGEKREFDFSLDATNASNRRTYYFRIVYADGTPLTNYTRYPTITVGVPNQKVMRGGKFFNYKSEQPFTF